MGGKEEERAERAEWQSAFGAGAEVGEIAKADGDDDEDAGGFGEPVTF